MRFQDKIFVMLVRGRLVLKLPADRVDALISAGDGVRFDANKGTPMREWFSLDPQSRLPWSQSLAAAGIRAHDALAAGSWAARAYLGQPGLAEGAPADAVVYDSDPRADLGQLDRPRAVILRGRVRARR
ncbi:MAG TPA: hypothetical protein VMI33_14405 [Streptosporangiaceae bacterium]|nr:hypothetical protein [Streptosporangiaceae bacterium]